MEKRIFVTRIKRNHKLSGNEFVIGKISGIQHMFNSPEDGEITEFAIVAHDDGSCDLRVACSETRYKVFVGIVEKLYPGLCEFDVKKH